MITLQENISLRPFNSFGIDVKARYFVEIQEEADLRQLFDQGTLQLHPLLVVGGGSNLLFTRDFEGLVIRVGIQGLKVEGEGADVVVEAGAGLVWDELVQYCVGQGLGGIENLRLIPGTVGASPIQNIGAYGVELKDVFLSCAAFEIATGKMLHFDKEACGFGYRESVFKGALKGKYILTRVRFHLQKGGEVKTHYGAIEAELHQRGVTSPTIADVAEVVAAIRVSKLPDPSTIGNAGSFFKNPIISRDAFQTLVTSFPDIVHFPVGNTQVKLAAGWLIEQCGFKGMVSGNTGTWKNQALVLVNHGGATGQEVYSFSEQIIRAVSAKFHVVLEREVNVY